MCFFYQNGSFDTLRKSYGVLSVNNIYANLETAVFSRKPLNGSF